MYFEIRVCRSMGSAVLADGEFVGKAPVLGNAILQIMADAISQGLEQKEPRESLAEFDTGDSVMLFEDIQNGDEFWYRIKTMGGDINGHGTA